jgi:arginine/lysine/ornithine decarboxylase
MASLDISRKSLALGGASIFRHVKEMAAYARGEINRIGTYYAYGDELIDGGAVFGFDTTKLAVSTFGTGLSGIEVYDLLRDEYNIQAEFGDTSNLLAYISVGDRRQEIERLIGALSEISRRFRRPPEKLPVHPMPATIVRTSPQEAFYARKVSVPLEQSEGRVCGETVMCYPPGIPILAPGELITKQAVEYIKFAKERGCFLAGTRDPGAESLRVLA